MADNIMGYIKRSTIPCGDVDDTWLKMLIFKKDCWLNTL